MNSYALLNKVEHLLIFIAYQDSRLYGVNPPNYRRLNSERTQDRRPHKRAKYSLNGKTKGLIHLHNIPFIGWVGVPKRPAGDPCASSA